MFQRLRNACGVLGGALSVSLLVQGCAQEMANQPRVDALEPSHFQFMNDVTNRTPVPGTVARGRNLEMTPVQTAMDNGSVVKSIPVPVTEELLARGQQRYNIFCQHCHGLTGNADGMVVQRGFPAPPSYQLERLKTAADGQLFLTIQNGVSRMPAFGNRISVEDRWAIVAYIRALQLSQSASADSLEEVDREALNKN